MTQSQILETWNNLTSIFFLVMLVLACVSLMVGGIGVTAIMITDTGYKRVRSQRRWPSRRTHPSLS